MISIHAPREGSDLRLFSFPLLHSISIHAPREGSDQVSPRFLVAFTISIHAPREGSDFFSGSGSSLMAYFYPRSPRGERRASKTISETKR